VSTARHVARALPTMLRVSFAEVLAYRAEIVVWMLAYTMPLIMLALWTAVARDAPVGRFDQRGFQAYFLMSLIVRFCTSAWVVWEMNFEVRQGTLQRRLLRPIHPLIGYACEQAAALPLRFVLMVPILIATLSWLGTSIVTRDPVQLALVLPSIAGAWCLMFLTMALIGTLSLWWESSIAAWEVWIGLYMVFSGYVMPIELFPGWLRAALDVLPFRYMLSSPVENILGLCSRGDSLRAVAIQWLMAALLALALRRAWARGVKRFQAFGG
jgi:ABC-2 type transport system permease protein